MEADRTRSVMVVEDERIVAKDLQQTLAGMGYDAFAIAASAEEAVARASERCPDVVLMDIRIKGRRDGVETAWRSTKSCSAPGRRTRPGWPVRAPPSRVSSPNPMLLPERALIPPGAWLAPP